MSRVRLRREGERAGAVNEGSDVWTGGGGRLRGGAQAELAPETGKASPRPPIRPYDDCATEANEGASASVCLHPNARSRNARSIGPPSLRRQQPSTTQIQADLSDARTRQSVLPTSAGLINRKLTGSVSVVFPSTSEYLSERTLNLRAHPRLPQHVSLHDVAPRSSSPRQPFLRPPHGPRHIGSSTAAECHSSSKTTVKHLRQSAAKSTAGAASP